MFIGSLEISSSVRPKIVAEIGINHNGCLDSAKSLCDLAVESGADIVKTQFHIPDQEMSDTAREIVPSHCDNSIFDIMQDCSLSIDDEYLLKEHIESLGVPYLSTPFSVKAARLLGDSFGVKAFKIGSGECNNNCILDAVSAFGLPLIISTGMNSLASCELTYNYVSHNYGIHPLLMHTTNIYPTPRHLVRLGGVLELQRIAGINSVGLSDHTTDNLACLGSVALGAVLLERHFTDTFEREGPDIANSMDPSQLRDLKILSNQMFEMRGGSKIDCITEEQNTRDFAFATVVTTSHLYPGDLLSLSNTSVKRPGCGDFLARDYSGLINRRVRCELKSGTHILHQHLSSNNV